MRDDRELRIDLAIDAIREEMTIIGRIMYETDEIERMFLQRMQEIERMKEHASDNIIRLTRYVNEIDELLENDKSNRYLLYLRRNIDGLLIKITSFAVSNGVNIADVIKKTEWHDDLYSILENGEEINEDF